MSAQPATMTSSARQSAAIGWLASLVVAGLLIWVVIRALHIGGSAAAQPAESLPWWGLGSIPFVAMLGAIAIFPLIPAARHWWEDNRHRLAVSLLCGGLALGYYAIVRGPGFLPHVLDHALGAEYIPFITLLFCLYVISGGISLTGDIPAHPTTNTAFLAVGAAIASIIGTTGASVLLIRPLLQTNSERKHVTHTVIFFIFLVSNVGGCLLPIGDPPLFLGYLAGVPFRWTLGLWKEWALCCAILLMVYYVWDVVAYKREEPSAIQHDEAVRVPLSLRGKINFAWLIGVVLSVVLLDANKSFPGTDLKPPVFVRELVMLGFAALSLLTTPRGVRQDNRFNYHAILEVAALFIGIFITMQVPIEILNARGGELGLTEPWQFFWATGGLSSFLDNAPTYVVFFEAANAMTHEPGEGILKLVSGHYIREDLLIAISLGSVFMGANTYIGNGPNFMVKSIAEQSGVKMPGFFGYMIGYSLPILIPIFLLVTLIFMRTW